ncbi:MAG TPA: Trk system potassium transporter TrkA, partial [Lachnospiraceae bacterium]|nr:Trk system potassium transporter TrkA [Lachnospiraceae bacterium]
RLPSGIRADYFARHSFEMVELRTKMNSTFSNMNVSDLRRHFKENFLICAVGRGSDVYIPRGDFVLRDGDLLTINAAPTEIDKLLTEVGYINKPVRNVMIIGGSRTAYQLGKILIESGIRVKIIEQDRDRCRQLCESLPEAVVINGDGAQGELLNEEGLLTTDAFVSLTGMDEENILMCIYANEQRVPRAMCKVDRSAFADLAGRLGVEGLVSPNVRVSSLVLRYVRALENSAGSNIETLYKLMDGRAEAMEFIVKPDFPYLNIPLYQLEFKPGMLIGGIIRDTKPLIPGGNDHIEAKDRVIVLAAGQNLVSLSDAIIKVKES